MSRVLSSRTAAHKRWKFSLCWRRRASRWETASQGKEALACLMRALPDVVLTDLEMPEMNGLQLVEAVRRDYPAVPVILMTAVRQ